MMQGPCPQSRSARTSLGYVKFREAGAVAVAGALGTAARIGVDNAAELAGLESGISTLGVNIIGAFFLGLVVGHGLPTLSPALRSALGVGFLGAFTTFSAVSLFVATATLGVGVGFLALHFSVGVFAAWSGWQAGHRLRVRQEVPA